MLNEWGPAILVCLTVVVGFFYSNSRMTDLRNDVNARLNAMDKRFDARFDDLKDWIRAEIRRLEERTSPIHRA
jgi:hypothetical protein